MPNANTRYVTWNYRGKRGHGSASSDIVTPPPPSSLSTGDKFQAGWASPTVPYVDSNGNPQIANFAFWSITGGTSGALVSTNNTAPVVDVGTADVFATAWYLPGGGGPGGPGIFIDAFDIDLGNFVDDDFVNVVPNELHDGVPVTSTANNQGCVPTDVARDIGAYATIPIHLIPFSDWKVVWESKPDGTPSKMTVAGQVLHVEAGAVAVAFAFYKASAGYIGPTWIDVRTKPGPISIGYQAMLWIDAERIRSLISQYKLKSLPVETERTFSNLPGQCGIKVPHVHYQGKTYLLSTEQWNKFAGDVQKELGKKLASAKSVTFNKLIEINEAIAELP